MLIVFLRLQPIYRKTRIKMRRNRHYLDEAVNPLDKIQALIDQANSAYAQAIEHQGETE